MYIISDFEKLEGKTIAFSHMPQFSDFITLATTDGGIMMVTISGSEYGDDPEVEVFHKGKVLQKLSDENSYSKFLRGRLAEKGIYDLVAYKEQKRIKEEKDKIQRQENLKESELKKLAELKAKYE